MSFRISAALLDGVHTDFVVSVFEDTIFIVVTQNSKVGTFYLFSPELSSDDLGYNLQVLFGRDDDSVSSSVVSLMRKLDVDRRTIISLMLVDSSNFRTLRAVQKILSLLM